MNEKYVIGLDYGTLSGRAVVVRCSDGAVVGSAEKVYRHGVIDTYLPGCDGRLPDQYALQHPGDYLEVLEAIVTEAVAKAVAAPAQIIGISAGFTASTVMPVDQEGIPLCLKPGFEGRPHAYAKLWKHHGAVKETEQINQLLEELDLLNDPRYGGKISSELLVPKALEMLRNDPDLYEYADEILEAGDWLTRVLTGSRQRSGSMAGYKAWWQPGSGYPDRSFFTHLDPRMSRFTEQKLSGEICPVGGRIGTLSKEWADKLKLPEGIAVGAAVIDSHAGVPGCGISEKGQMMLVIGTSSVAVAVSDIPYTEKGVCGSFKGGIVPEYYGLESGLAAVGDMFAWFVEHGVPAAYTEAAARQGKSVHEYLSELAGTAAPGASGLMILDWWNGNKTPFVDARLSGVILGLTLQTKPEDVYRALIEATAYGTRLITETFETAGIEINEVIASGGIAFKNPLLMQIYADVLGRPLKIAGSTQTAAVGAAVYAAVAAGAARGGYDSYREAVRQMTGNSSRCYLPSPEAVHSYNRLYREYQEAGSLLGGKSEILKRLKTF